MSPWFRAMRGSASSTSLEALRPTRTQSAVTSLRTCTMRPARLRLCEMTSSFKSAPGLRLPVEEDGDHVRGERGEQGDRERDVEVEPEVEPAP